jgi:hypothetical protein
MAYAPRSSRGHVDLARISFGVSNEFRDCLGRHGWIDHHDKGGAGNARDRRDVADEIIIEIAIERSVGRIIRTGEKERIAVRGRLHDRLGADIVGGAGPVFDNKRLTKTLR